ncbi:MAG: MarR family transcriptional regulator [Ruminiclostridium sp.]|nr:MarR family transcriptional regulator [Ruminiclostridium sp.]
MEKNYEMLRLGNQLCFPLYACSREIVKKYNPLLAELGITYTQYIVMLVMWEERRISVKELGAKLYLDSGTLTPVLKSLAAKGFVTRERSAEDERVLIIELTAEGEALKERAVEIPPKIGCCVQLTGDEAVELHRLLYKVLGGM